MHFRKTRITGILLCVATALSSCAGGGETGTGFTDLSVGTITGFGSVFVNGVEFETTQTDVSLDGLAGSQNDLRIGMVVTVRGLIDGNGTTGVAGSISVEEVIKGPVEAVGVDTLTVMNQTVQVDQNTRFENALTIASLTTSDTVEVSGYVKGAGIILATRIEKIDPLSEYKLKGIATNVSAAGFNLGALTVSYPNADTVITNNSPVEVKGTYSTGQIIASKIESDALEVNDAKNFELQGFVSAMTNATDFLINNLPVHTDTTTNFDGGTVTEIAVGSQVEASGSLVNGVLYAREISFKDSIRLDSSVASVDAVNRSLTLTDLPGLIIKTNSATELKGDAENGFATITTGGSISVRGYLAAGNVNTIIATELEWVAQYDGKVTLQAPLDTTPGDQANLSLLGTTINTNGLADSVFDIDTTANPRQAFFTTVVTGNIVRLEGLYTGGVFEWTKIDLDD